jgi:hypothetical protein
MQVTGVKTAGNRKKKKSKTLGSKENVDKGNKRNAR